MSKRPGKDCVVKLGANTVVGMGTWSISGVTADKMETSEFGDNWKTYAFGMKDGGTISFSGLSDPDDTTGQEALKLANVENTDLTDIRFYVDDTSYYHPNSTTGYFSPASTTGNDTPASCYCNVDSYSESADKSGMLMIDFTATVSGVMVLV